jgi:hypothetical protein
VASGCGAGLIQSNRMGEVLELDCLKADGDKRQKLLVDIDPNTSDSPCGNNNIQTVE